MIVYITTAGYQLEGPLVQYYEIATDVLEGIIDQDRKFYFMAEMDNVDEIENPELWIKANPNMGVSLDLPSLIDDWNTDKHTDAEKMTGLQSNLTSLLIMMKCPLLVLRY